MPVRLFSSIAIMEICRIIFNGMREICEPQCDISVNMTGSR